jgi:hypothetical protein
VLAPKVNFRQDDQAFERTDVPVDALEAKKKVLASLHKDVLGIAKPDWNASTGPNKSGIPLRARIRSLTEVRSPSVVSRLVCFLIC